MDLVWIHRRARRKRVQVHEGKQAGKIDILSGPGHENIDLFLLFLMNLDTFRRARLCIQTNPLSLAPRRSRLHRFSASLETRTPHRSAGPPQSGSRAILLILNNFVGPSSQRRPILLRDAAIVDTFTTLQSASYLPLDGGASFSPFFVPLRYRAQPPCHELHSISSPAQA